MSRALEELVELVAQLPGIGPRQARRVVQFLLRSNTTYRTNLAKKIQDIAKEVSQCNACFRFDATGSEKLCALCANKNRDRTLLMVVEKDVDIESVEQTNIFNGVYFVLGALMPLARQRKVSGTIRVDALRKRLKNDNEVAEVVLAFATTPEGDFTAKELIQTLKEHFPTLKVSTLGRGLSLGAEIEYADQETLKNAFDGRH